MVLGIWMLTWENVFMASHPRVLLSVAACRVAIRYTLGTGHHSVTWNIKLILQDLQWVVKLEKKINALEISYLLPSHSALQRCYHA